MSVSGLTLDIGGFVTIEGNVSLSTVGGAVVFAGEGLRLFIGRGPATLGTGGLNPLATGVLVTDARIGLVQANGGYALVASGTVRLVGVDGVTLAGTASIAVNTTAGIVDQTIAVAGSTGDPVVVSFPTAARVTRFELTGATLGLLGQTLTADLVVDRTAAGDLVLGVAHASLSLGGAVSLTDGAGALVLGPTGAAGVLSGHLAVTSPGLTFGAGLELARQHDRRRGEPQRHRRYDDHPRRPGRRPLPARRGHRHRDHRSRTSTSPATSRCERTVALDGTATTTIGLDHVAVTLGNGTYGVSLANGQGVLLVTAAGVAGRLAGQLTVTLPAGVTMAGALGLAVNTTLAAVRTTVTVGGAPLALDLAAGPYLRFEATGLVLTVLGQRITGDFAVERVVSDTGTPLVRVAAANVGVDVGGVAHAAQRQPADAAHPDRAGRPGQRDRRASWCRNVSVGGTLQLQVNTTGAKVDTTFLVAGSPTTLTLPGGPYVSVSGTGLDLAVLGQTLHGDLTITRTTDAAGRSVVHLVGQHLVLSLGGGTAAATVTQTGTADLVLAPEGVTGTLQAAVALSAPGVSLVTGTGGSITVARRHPRQQPVRPGRRHRGAAVAARPDPRRRRARRAGHHPRRHRRPGRRSSTASSTCSAR